MGGLLDGVGGSQAGSPPCVVAFGGMCARVGWAAAFFQDIYNQCRGRLEKLLIKVATWKHYTLAWNGICIHLIFAAIDATDGMSSCRLLCFHQSNPTLLSTHSSLLLFLHCDAKLKTLNRTSIVKPVPSPLSCPYSRNSLPFRFPMSQSLAPAGEDAVEADKEKFSLEIISTRLGQEINRGVFAKCVVLFFLFFFTICN